LFIRLALQYRHASSGFRSGFFDAAYDVRNSPLTAPFVAHQIAEEIAWFAENLKKPTRFNRSQAKGAYRRNAKGLSWFKPTATEHIRRAFALSAILRDHGYAVMTLKTDRPGFVVYEDDHQIVAEPFADTPT
jgi:hypothetical protein